MAAGDFGNFTTGPSTLPDVGELSYNGCVFSPLYYSNISGKCISDDANRTIKFMEYVITVDGYVTLVAGEDTVSPTMVNLRSLLTAQGGPLSYQGRGNDIVVNIGNSTKDAAWGPVPELLEFQPLGGGKSAKIKWSVKVHIVEPQPGKGGGVGAGIAGGAPDPIGFFAAGPPNAIPGKGPGFKDKQGPPGAANAKPPRMLQFNYESSISYGEDGYSTLSNRGILEIPLTRDPTQATRTFSSTADHLRGEIERRIMGGIDLRKFRMVRRSFNTSRDKRVLIWDFSAEEKPYMDLPAFCTVARGSYSVRPARSGMGLCTWLCTLRATYTVRKDKPRRIAWGSFLMLLRTRMSQSSLGNIPEQPKAPQAPPRSAISVAIELNITAFFGVEAAKIYRGIFKAQEKQVQLSKKALLIDFNIEEGMYLDSKTISFSATWKLITTFSHILLASGIWTKIEDEKGELWSTSIKDMSGAQSWLADKADPDIIVDFGGG